MDTMLFILFVLFAMWGFALLCFAALIFPILFIVFMRGAWWYTKASL